jgi:phosphate:Na+ symporter
MGMLIALAAEGLIPLSAALPILYGDNIGTCVTSLLSSIGASKNARRAAIMHLSFNIIGTILFMLFLNGPISILVMYLDPNNTARQLANAHTLFNLINVIIQLPFAGLLVKLAMKIIPVKDDENEYRPTKYLDDRMLETPEIALGNTVKEVLRMGNKAREALESTVDGLFEKSIDKVNKTFEIEKLINQLQKDLLNYLLKLSKTPLSENAREIVDELFNTVNDIERIGDHAENIAELAKAAIERDSNLSEKGIEELKVLYDKVLSTYKYSLESMKNGDVDLAYRVIKMEKQVDLMERSCRSNHMHRLNNNLCSVDSGVIFLDLISNLERVSDHSVNIAQQVIKSGSLIKKQY